MKISIEDILKNFKNNKIIIKQLGFLETYFEIENFEYKMEYDILKIYDNNNKNFITINLNQLYNIIYENEQLKLYLENDTIIMIAIKR